MPTIQENLYQLKASIRALEKKYARAPCSVSLLAMSKGREVSLIAEAIAGGQRLFGENYLQEALTKMAVLTEPGLEWHFTGKLQSNKTRQIAERFSWVHTVADNRSAQRLNDQRPATLPPLNICLEINLSHEASKTGLQDEAALNKLAEYCQALPRLKLRGLMAIPKPTLNFVEQRAAFHKLAKLKDQLCRQGYFLDTLSMGMTDDLEAAIAEGATFIRIGRGLFGPPP